MKAEDQFHIGIVADDFEATLAELSEGFGYEWCDEVGSTTTVTTPNGDIVVDMRCVYSTAAPRVEVVRRVPGTLWEPVEGGGIHHVGYWSDDVVADCAELAGKGYTVEATRIGADGAMTFAFLRGSKGLLIELVNRATQPGLETVWQIRTGTTAPAR
ncbi:VOC family protein [Yinghuangia sp. ASG 101]|uniref:VOC family protein n=1 Tax=Yinghuangia sp. ASG 101 TaxID=2896848 RepID=UPI001E53C5D2|nr:VOC family protein [Yinghuangia sp. ASG 101]UGQ13229.1 VOC family protein [Yinghuangia sp. ASG 101]